MGEELTEQQRNVIEASKYLTLTIVFPMFDDNVNSGDDVTTREFIHMPRVVFGGKKRIDKRAGRG